MEKQMTFWKLFLRIEGDVILCDNDSPDMMLISLWEKMRIAPGKGFMEIVVLWEALLLGR